MILTSDRGFAEWGDIFGDPVVATALLHRLLHHAIVIQVEGAGFRLKNHADPIPGHIRATAPISPPPPKRRARPPGKRSKDEQTRLVTGTRKWGKSSRNFRGKLLRH